jgi:hypothetical protein
LKLIDYDNDSIEEIVESRIEQHCSLEVIPVEEIEEEEN